MRTVRRGEGGLGGGGVDETVGPEVDAPAARPPGGCASHTQRHARAIKAEKKREVRREQSGTPWVRGAEPGPGARRAPLPDVGGGEELPARAEAEGGDGLAQAEALEEAGGGHVPDAHDAVHARGHEPLGVGAEGEVRDAVAVLRENADAARRGGGDVEDADGAVGADAGEER